MSVLYCFIKKKFGSILFTKLDIGYKLIWFPKDSNFMRCLECFLSFSTLSHMMFGLREKTGTLFPPPPQSLFNDGGR